MAVEQSGATEVTFELERFEWAAPGRIELEGVWNGLRGRRFIRPTLVLKGEKEPKRVLATLEHKPWAVGADGRWAAAFELDGGPSKFEAAELNVGSAIDLALPPPRLRPGKPRRFPQRIVAHDATREAQTRPSLASPGIVTEPLEPAASDGNGEPAEAKAESPPAAATTVDRAELDRVRAELGAARGQIRSLRAELEAQRQAQERVVSEARADEREKAAAMLAEGAELRAAMERQRTLAYEARDDAIADRDKAFAERDKAVADRDQAVRERKAAERERDRAYGARDIAHRERDRAYAARDKAVAERDQAFQERDEANRERDKIVSIHERDLPVHPPKPRFLPEPEDDRNEAEVWAVRSVAIGIVVTFAIIVLHVIGAI